ncbi:MAG: response regulator, partial [Clostridiales bacterium]|nr:response regulator [Clostridiales bacterium]
MVRILWVEDSKELRELVIDFFKRKGMEISKVAADGYAAMQLIEEHDFDLAIIDIMLPGPSGLDLCKALRKKSDCPIIFLTALGSEDS